MAERHPSLERLRRKLSHYVETPTSEELEALTTTFGPLQSVPRGAWITTQDSTPTRCSLLVSGFAGRSVLLRGGEQQTTAVHVPGDFIDLHGLLLNSIDHGIVAFTACEVMSAPVASLKAVVDDHPPLGRALWFLTIIDAAVHRRWLTVLGRRPALGRCAHLICELYARLDDVGLVERGRFHMPLSQARVGEILALSAVHVNRVIQELRARGLVVWERGLLTVLDFDALAAVGEFDAGYLQLQPAARGPETSRPSLGARALARSA